MSDNDRILPMIKPTFMHKASMLKWKALRWLQLSDVSYHDDMITFTFKTSTYGISFKVETKAHSIIYGEPYIDTNEAYRYFKEIKYNELEVD